MRRQTDDFELIWVGTETRDYGDKRWGGWPPAAAAFIMRWLGGIGGDKCGGGWYDPLGTTEHTYLEQARGTILGGARASTLFAYGVLQRDGLRLFSDGSWVIENFNRDQLYWLNDDPREQRNLAADPSHAATLAEMKRELQRHLAAMPGGFGELKPLP